jgi:transcriptional regulator with XRE-family HTH domain
MKNLRTAFGIHMQARRKALGLTQAQLADKVDLSVDTIGQIERGKIAPSFDNIGALADALGVHPAELFGGLSRVPGKRNQPVQKIVDKLVQATPQQVAKVGKVIDAILDE